MCKFRWRSETKFFPYQPPVRLVEPLVGLVVFLHTPSNYNSNNKQEILPWSSSPQTQWRSRLWPCCGHRQNDSPCTGDDLSCSVYVRSSVPCSCRTRCAPTPRLPRLRSPPGLPTLRVATFDLSALAADDDGPATGSPAALRAGDVVELELWRLPSEDPAGKVSPNVGSLKRLTGDGRPSTGIWGSMSSLPFAISPFSPSPADDSDNDASARGAIPASLRDRLVGTRRPLSLAIELSQFLEITVTVHKVYLMLFAKFQHYFQFGFILKFYTK